MKNLLLLFTSLAALCGGAARVAYFPMDQRDGLIYENVSSTPLIAYGARPALNLPGAVGNALWFDGYSTIVDSQLPDLGTFSKATITLWVAPETYPMISLDQPSAELALLAGTYDSTSKSGFGFFLGREGEVEYRSFSGGWPVNVKASEKLPLGIWTRLTATFDGESRSIRLYFNDTPVGEGKGGAQFSIPGNYMRFGGNGQGIWHHDFRLDTFSGMIDDLEIFNTVVEPSSLSMIAENEPDFNLPEEWWEDQLMRPRYHAMPASGWMNESHGLTYADGRYHLFFQKNGNGPYMSRLHWGHLSSADLCSWKEEKVAVAPGEDYDLKGCWSGCVFADPELTHDKPHIFYTAVDYGKALIAEAAPSDDKLLAWEKKGIVLDGRPEGLSDDFRDCFIFRNGNDYYMIVGTSKDNRGAATLHHLNPATGQWSNDGSIFFQAPSQSVGGRFWEMPNVTRIGEHWLFTVTPLDMPQGVETIYWVGDINPDGTFSPITPLEKPGKVELEGMSADGYGLLSPTVYTREGKTIAMGIVPDKLPESANYRLGWAHNISFPREWTLEGNQLVQRPAEALKALRNADSRFEKTNFNLSSTLTLEPVNGRAYEVEMIFKKGAGKTGLHLFKNDSRYVTLEYDPSSNSITVDATSLQRLDNDSHSFNGLYTSALPENIPMGEEMKIHAFVDHSILEVFINDRYAFAIRIFPDDPYADGLEAFSSAATEVVSLKAWNFLPPGVNGASKVIATDSFHPCVSSTQGGLTIMGVPDGTTLRIYDLSGTILYEANTTASEANTTASCYPISLQPGLYLISLAKGEYRSFIKFHHK